MSERPLDIASDYNSTAPGTAARPALIAIGLGLLAFAIFLPFDGAIDHFMHGRALGGDVRRELEALQQYGQGSFTVLLMAVVFLLDRPRRAALWDWGFALALLGLVVTGLKMVVGRPRPRLVDPYLPLEFLGPFGSYPLSHKGGPPELVYAWQFWKPGISDLWSMPSSHTAFAVCSSVVLGTLYPRLRPVVIVLALLVAVCRVLFDSHYPSDVAIGATAGFAVTVVVVRRGIGRGLAGRLGLPCGARAAE